MHVTAILVVAVVAVGISASTVVADGNGKYFGTIWKGRPGREWAPGPLVSASFTQLTLENAGKWEQVEARRGVRRWDSVAAMFAYAGKHDMQAKYHCFVWGMQQPEWTKNADDMKAALDAFLSDYYARFAGKAGTIDVVNEPISNPAGYRKQLGGNGKTEWDWVVYSFERAQHFADKHGCDADRILNEWGILRDAKKRTRFMEIVRILQQRNLIDGIGAQGHFLEKANLESVRRGLDELAQAGLPVHISEFELDIADDETHRKKFAELFPVFWEHPAVKGVTVWGHREGSMWRKNGYLFRKDGTDRAAMTWLRQYLEQHPAR